MAARILNATLVIPKMDENSFWKDARFVLKLLLLACKGFINFFYILFWTNFSVMYIYLILNWIFVNSTFSEIFDVDWFISLLKYDVKIVKEIPKKGGKTVAAPYTMRVPRKCTPKCYQSRVLPALMKKHVSTVWWNFS